MAPWAALTHPRRAAAAILDGRRLNAAHPFSWAPFTLIGEAVGNVISAGALWISPQDHNNGSLRFPCAARRRTLPLSFRRFLFCLAAHSDEFVDQHIDRLALLHVATHPNQRIEKVVEGLFL